MQLEHICMSSCIYYSGVQGDLITCAHFSYSNSAISQPIPPCSHTLRAVDTAEMQNRTLVEPVCGHEESPHDVRNVTFHTCFLTPHLDVLCVTDDQPCAQMFNVHQLPDGGRTTA